MLSNGDWKETMPDATITKLSVMVDISVTKEKMSTPSI